MPFLLNLPCEKADLSDELSDKLMNDFDDALLFSKDGKVYLDFHDRSDDSIENVISDLEKIGIMAIRVSNQQ